MKRFNYYITWYAIEILFFQILKVLNLQGRWFGRNVFLPFGIEVFLSGNELFMHDLYVFLFHMRFITVN
jgi:hypothetical protein